MSMVDVFLNGGDLFTITTKKPVTLLEGSPIPVVFKESTYNVVCGETLIQRIGQVIGTWWTWAFPNRSLKIVTHKRTSKPYLLCALDKEAKVYGSSMFFTGEGEIVEKDVIKAWIPKQVFDSAHMTIPLDTIVGAQPYSMGVAPVKVDDGLPF